LERVVALAEGRDCRRGIGFEMVNGDGYYCDLRGSDEEGIRVGEIAGGE
jgi:hypothetical protein